LIARHFYRAVLVFLFIFSFTITLPLHGENYLSHSVSATLLVTDPEKSSDLITEWVEGSGGLYLFKSNDRVVFRFPYEKIKGLRNLLEETADEIVDISFEAQDVRERIVQLRSGIASREEILTKNMSYLGRANVAGTLAIEREILRLVQEIETLKGELRRLEVERVLAWGEVNLNFKQQTLPDDIPSSFGWINTVDFIRFLQGGHTR
jgi:hypothetical protein